MGNIYIALGANLSNPKETFVEAIAALEDKGVTVTKLSGLWKSPSWPPGKGHPDYINAAAEVEFQGSATDLLSILMDVEKAFGRKRSVKNAPRILDLDIIDFGSEVISSGNLTLPHPRMYDRGFVLFPLDQITDLWRDPVSGKDLNYFIQRLSLKNVEQIDYIGPLKI